MSCTGKRRAAAVLALLLLIGGFFETDTERVHATASTRKKLQEAEEEKKKTEAELGQTKEDLEDLNEEKNALQGKLNTLNNQLQEVSAKLEELEAQIKDKKAEIEVTKAELADARATEEWQYECMKKRIQFMYETQDYIMLEMFFSSASFADLLNRSDYIEQLSAYDRKKLEEYIEIKEQIEEVEARLEEEQEELEEYRAQVEEQKSQESGLVSQTSTSVAGKKNEISQAESEALAYEQQLVEQEENIKKLQEKLAEEIRLSQLAAQSAWRDISEVSFAEGDRYLLANLIYCEAGGESYAGQLGVGSVVINRVLSSVYPDSVVGVIYQGGQFSPVASGRLAAALAGGSATASCYQAADAAMSGNTNVGNCVYFRTPIEGLSGIQIGGHIFY